MIKKLALGIFLILMVVLRVFLAINAKHGDMYNNLDWGYGALKYGLTEFYELPKIYWDHSRPNQPPGSIYLHAASVIVNQEVSRAIWNLNLKVSWFPSALVWWWQLHGELLSIKIPSIVADFFIFAAILRFGRLMKTPRTSLVVGIVFLANPALWYNSAFWGHTDAVVAALVIWSLVTIFEGRTIVSPVLLGLSIITKASWALAVPFYVVYFAYKFPRKIAFLLAGPIAALALTIPFHPAWDLPVWLVNLYTSRILGGESAYITVIAFNFWNLIFAPDLVSHKIAFLGFPANLVGWAIVAVFGIAFARRLIKRPSPLSLLWLTALLSFAIFLFAPKMIHRYLYPVFPLISLCLVGFKKTWLLWLAYGGLSVCYIINLYYKWWAPGNLWLQSWYTDANTKIISVIYLVIFAVLCFYSTSSSKEV